MLVLSKDTHISTNRMPKRKSSAVAGGLTKKRKTQSVSQDVKKIKKILSEGQEWKHVSFQDFTTSSPVVRTAPYCICLNLIAEGTGPQERNGRKCYLQKGVISFQLHWSNVSTPVFHPVRVMVICALRNNPIGSIATPEDSARGQVIINEILKGSSNAYNYSSTFPQVTELTALKQDGSALRGNYLILHDKIYKPPYITEYYDSTAATRKGTGGYLSKKLTWSLKNHEMIFGDSTQSRPRDRQVWVLMWTNETVSGDIEVRCEARQTFTENKLD